jgi:type IV pilus assembly protein PilV
VANPSKRGTQRGVSLVEVLVAVLIFSLGLVGLAGLLVMSTRSNQTAFARTQITFLASNMADRMRANPVALWNDYYSTTYPVSDAAPACSAAKPCTPDDLATRDKVLWGTMLKTFVPGLGKTTIKCDVSGAGYSPTTEVALRPPYGGVCTMIVTWAERGYGTTDDKSDAGNLQSFTWVFEP